jgi:hypothetical protein
MAISTGHMLDILRDEKDIFIELVVLSNVEHQYIMENNIEGLMEVTGKKERLALAVRELEKKRNALLGSSMEVEPISNQRFMDISENFDSNSADEASSLREELIAVIKEFDNINYSNAELLRRSLDYVTLMLDTILPDDNPTYSDKNAINRVSPMLFDGKA